MSSLATTTEAATRSPQSLASGGDDEGWWIYFRAEAPDGWPERARAEPVVAKLAKERPVLAAATEKRCGAGDAREVSRDAALRQRDAAVVERDAAVEALRSQTLANAPPPGRWRGRGLDDADRGRVAAGLVGDEVLNGEVGEILNGGYDDYPEPPPLVVDRDLARPPSAPGRRGGGDGQRRRSPAREPPRAASRERPASARARKNGEAPPRTNGDRAAPYADGDRPSRRARASPKKAAKDRGAAPERRAKHSPGSAYDGGEAGPSGQERRRSDARRLAELVRATAVVVDRVEHRAARDLAARCDRPPVRRRDAGAPRRSPSPLRSASCERPAWRATSRAPTRAWEDIAKSSVRARTPRRGRGESPKPPAARPNGHRSVDASPASRADSSRDRKPKRGASADPPKRASSAGPRKARPTPRGRAP
ncbi:hypothetical protein AURANDRAFT_63067 [Aureococcus anophagefferens]|uniref:Uncharacterized protein n=1 Tax=Aureococcus anophagefferens TaxID=44056 RepID=F0Y599_AURAN|nr:hypothetical protein AURANDRAFT_63067 [Aureococcus anophagefferens]EGB09837.1 hypothetical protein AURANDRAFT_63067 [Aureococcus anophagefferens]|eukprot:XP_009035869.1 hypothetical protein AURANDRAFT_63067 [Aureococcus anophagefferens]